MNSAITQSAISPDDPVRTALDDATLQDALLHHAFAVLGRYLADRPVTDRIDKAKESLQETNVRALQKGHDFDPNRPVRPWLHGIMNNVLSEMTRALRRSPAQESADVAAWERLAIEPASAAAAIVPNRLDVAGYLEKLPPEHRAVLQLRFYEDLSHEEIGVRLGISPGNARVRLCRALNAVKVIAGVALEEERP